MRPNIAIFQCTVIFSLSYSFLTYLSLASILYEFLCFPLSIIKCDFLLVVVQVKAILRIPGGSSVRTDWYLCCLPFLHL